MESGKEPSYVVTLRTGVRTELRLVRVAWDMLTSLQDTHPGLFGAALAMARGNEVTPAVRRELRRNGLVGRDGGLLPHYREVLLAGYRDTAEGPVLVNPIRFDSEADRAAFDECERKAERNLRRFLAGDNGPVDPGPDPTR